MLYPKGTAAFWAASPSSHGFPKPLSTKTLPPWSREGCLVVPVKQQPLAKKQPVWNQRRVCLHRCVPSCAGDHATAPGHHPAAPAGLPWCWTAAAAVRSAPGAWESPVTSSMSATRARASSVTTARHLRGQEPPATVSMGCPLPAGDAPVPPAQHTAQVQPGPGQH